jgi:diguanylate cyclase (GGDEF)-like protein
VSVGYELLDSESELSARERLFDEVLASVELVLVADGAAFWREEPDHSLVLTASRSIAVDALAVLDRHATVPLQSIMQRWPESPLVAVPLNDPTNPIAEEVRQVTEREGIVGLAGVPCRVSGEMFGMLVVVHRRPHPWTVRDLGLATGLAGQLATAMQNSRLYSSVRSLANRLTAIHELSLRLNQLRDVDAIGEAIVAEVGRLVDCDTVRVYRLDPDDRVFRPVAASGTFAGVQSPPLESLSTAHGDTLPGWVARRNEPLIIADASSERRSIFRSTYGPESLLLVPISYGDEVQGVLVVSKEGLNKYGHDDEQALSIFARYAAQAMVNAENIKQLEKQHEMMEKQVAAERRLLDVSEQLVSTLDPRRVLEQIADTIGTVLRYDRLTVYRYDAPTGGIEAVLTRADSGDAASSSADASMDEGLTSWVIGRGEPACANGIGEDLLAVGPEGDKSFRGRTGSWAPATGQSGHHAGRSGRPAHSIIVVPLRVHGEVVGSLNMTRMGGVSAHFSEHEFELSKLFASQASIALQNAEAHVTVATRADLDALTGLRNHGTFQRDLANLIDSGSPFALLMMDLDSFKAFNDTYGHPAGDALLQTVSKAIVSATRQNDQAYRYGGDEFALLLIGATRRHAEDVAGRVRAAVRSSVQDSAVGGFGVRVSASVGAAHWPADGRSGAQLVEAADAALYRAKRGRSDRPEDIGLPETRGSIAVPSLLDAARDLLAAATAEEVAASTARHAAALLGAADSFAVLSEDLVAAPGLVLAVAGSATQSGARASMHQVSASGLFADRPASVRRGAAGGLWGRVWQSGTALYQEEGNERRLGVPIKVGGRVTGIVGASTSAGGSFGRDREQAAGLLAEMASIALQRTMGVSLMGREP